MEGLTTEGLAIEGALSVFMLKHTLLFDIAADWRGRIEEIDRFKALKKFASNEFLLDIFDAFVPPWKDGDGAVCFGTDIARGCGAALFAYFVSPNITFPLPTAPSNNAPSYWFAQRWHPLEW